MTDRNETEAPHSGEEHPSAYDLRRSRPVAVTTAHTFREQCAADVVVDVDTGHVVKNRFGPTPTYRDRNQSRLRSQVLGQERKQENMLSVLACREGSQWVVQAIEQDVAAQGATLLGALATLGQLFDARDLLLANGTETNVAPNPRAPSEYETELKQGHYVGVLPLGLVRVAQVYLGVSPFERQAQQSL